MIQEIQNDLVTISATLSDISRLIGKQNITPDQRHQCIKLAGQPGGVMQEMGTAIELEGWLVSKWHRQIKNINSRLDDVLRQIEGQRGESL